LDSAEESQVFHGFLPTPLSFIQTVDGTLNNKVYMDFAKRVLADANFNTNFDEENNKVSPPKELQPSVFVGKF
jgi:hypothetical protein